MFFSDSAHLDAHLNGILIVPAPTTPEMLWNEKRQDNEISRYVLVSTVRYPPTIHIGIRTVKAKKRWIGNESKEEYCQNPGGIPKGLCAIVFHVRASFVATDARGDGEAQGSPGLR